MSLKTEIKEAPPPTVRLTTQSFAEAGGLNVYPDLEMRTVIAAAGGSSWEVKGEAAAVADANKNLSETAKQEGFSHVFGIKYKLSYYGYPDSNRFKCYAEGTGYHSRGPRE